MNDREIECLKQALKHSNVLWNPDRRTAKVIVVVAPGPKPAPDDEPEPSECAYCSDGTYLALYGVDLHEFVTTKLIPVPAQEGGVL